MATGDRKGSSGTSPTVRNIFPCASRRCDVGAGLAPAHGFTPSRPLRSPSPRHTHSILLRSRFWGVSPTRPGRRLRVAARTLFLGETLFLRRYSYEAFHGGEDYCKPFGPMSLPRS